MKTWIALAVCAVLVACSGPSYEALVESARGNLAKKDARGAIAELKSALLKRPDSFDARLLLGQALLDVGEVSAAAVELEKAAQIGKSEDVVPLLARSLLYLGENKKVTERFTDTELKDARLSADLKTTVALAFVRLGMTEQAETMLAEALAVEPTYSPALTTKAAFMASRGDIDGALDQLDKVLAADPAARDAWQAKGEILLLAKDDIPTAARAFRKVIEIDKKHLPGYLRLFAIAKHERDSAAMAAVARDLTAVFPKHPQTLYIGAQVALLQKDFATARTNTQLLLKAQPDSVRVLQLAGTLEFQSRSLLQAETHLAKALRLAPEAAATRRLLAQTYLRSAQPDKALATLQPLLDPRRPDADALASAAEAHLQAGRPQQAEMFYQRAARLNPANPRVRTALALTQLAKGNADAAFSELQATAAADVGTYADLALVTARLRRNEYDAALKAVEAMAQKVPDKAFVANLRGQILRAKGDAPAAIKAFEEALALDAVYFPAAVNLARIDVAAKEFTKARGRFEGLLQADPKNSRALLAIAELVTRTGGKREEAEALLRKAVAAQPADPQARLALIRHYADQNDSKARLTEARAAGAALPGHVDVLEAVGLAQAAANEPLQAISTFTKLATAMPRSPIPHLRLAELHLAAKDHKQASESLHKALQLSPGLLQAQRGLIAIALADQRYIDALAIAREAQRARPRDEVGWIFEGDIEAKRGQWAEALAAYRNALQRVPSAEAASKVHAALLALKRDAEAQRFAAGWERDHSRDVAFLYYLGDQHLARKEYASAEMKYRAVIKLRPQHALAMNNAATAMLAQGKPGAIELAKQADAALPNVPEILDTLGSALAAEGRLAEAIAVQRRAVELRPAGPAFRLALAKFYLRHGERASARAELERLVPLGDKFAGAAEVRTLLAEAKQ